MQTKEIVEVFMNNEENEYMESESTDTDRHSIRKDDEFLLFHLLFSIE